MSAPSVRGPGIFVYATQVLIQDPPPSNFIFYDIVGNGPMVFPSYIQPGDCLILFGAAVAPSADWKNLVDIAPQGITAGPTPVMWKIADENDAGFTYDPNGFGVGLTGLLVYKHAGAGEPLVLGPSGTDFAHPVINAPIAPNVPANSTVLEIFLATGPAGSDIPTITLPATDRGQGFLNQQNSSVSSVEVQYPTTGGFGFDVTITDNPQTIVYGFADKVQVVAGPSAGDTASATFANGYNAWTVIIPGTAPPFAPTLATPANASTADLALSQEFTWRYNPSLNDGPQQFYAFRRKLNVPGSTYEYWNATTVAWSGTIVWNTSSLSSVTFPSGKWTDGNIYTWSVATQDTISGQKGAFAQDFIVTAQQSAAVTVTQPVGRVTAYNPLISWMAVFPGSFVQIGYRAVLYSEDQYGASGFEPGVGPSVWDSGPLVGTAVAIRSLIPSTYDGIPMRAYVQVIETNNDASAWEFSSFVPEVDAPAQPDLSAAIGTDPTTGLPVAVLTLQGHDNEVTTVDASVETGTGSWTPGANTTVTQSNAQALDQLNSLALKATGSGAISAKTGAYQVVSQ